jgi:RNA polymerase sigma factor (sigma-70 family)
MASVSKLHLADRGGNPLGDHIHAVLAALLPRFRRRFPRLRDDATVTDLIEEVGRRIAQHEVEHGSIEHMRGFAWKALFNLGVSWSRTPEAQLDYRLIAASQVGTILASAEADEGTPEEIHRSILIRELLERLSAEERFIILRRRAGFSSKEIGKALGRSVADVDTTYHRAIRKLQEFLRKGRKDPS